MNVHARKTKMGGRGRRHALALAATAALAMGCAEDMGYASENMEMLGWSANELTNLVVANTVDGNVTVSARNGDSIEVAVTGTCQGASQIEADKHRDCIAVADEVAGGELSVEALAAPGHRGRVGGARIDVFAPEDLPLSVLASAGDIAVRGVQSRLELLALEGDLLLEEIGGDVLAEAGGAIDAQFDQMGGYTVVDLVAGDDVVLTIPAHANLTFDLTAVDGRVQLQGLENVELSADDAGHVVGTMGHMESAAVVTVVAEAVQGRANVVLRAATSD